VKDAFDVLGLPPAFDLETKTLEQRYRDLQRALHPDKFAQASAAERRRSLSHAVSVNDAFRVLRDPIERAALLLARFGGATREHGGGTADPALLMEVMELREQLSDTKANRDTKAREKLANEVRTLDRRSTDELRQAFVSLEAGDRGALDVAARALSRLRYYRRFLDEVAVLEDAAD
jgi:molecular chaperone HscB